MQRGLPVFGGTERVPELLPSCRISGRYVLVDIAPEREVARLTAPARTNEAHSAANLPYSLLELLTVGSWRTMFPTESRWYLEGQCEAATHAARAINIGHVQRLSLTRVTPDDQSSKALSAPDLPIRSLSPVVLDVELEPLTSDYEPYVALPRPILPRDVNSRAGKFDDGVCRPGDLHECSRLCSSGSWRSCYNLALDRGVTSLGARSLLRAACDQRLGVACAALGLSYTALTEYPALRPALPPLYEAGCAAGAAFACTERARLFAFTAFDRGWKQALPVHERGCRAGSPQSCGWVAYDRTSKAQPSSALEIYRTTCRGGWLADCARWAAMVERGSGTPASQPMAIDLYRFACRRSDFYSCELLQSRGIETGHPGFPLVENPDTADAPP